MSNDRMNWRRRCFAVSIGALMVSAAASIYLFSPSAVDALPPRPTPAITPTSTPTRTPSPHVPRTMPAPLRLSHIRLAVTPAQDGLWSVVEWQGGDGTWHVVDGWQGTVEAGSKRWAVYERNFGEGPFRWVVSTARSGKIVGVSTPFMLPGEGVELLLRIEVAAD